MEGLGTLLLVATQLHGTQRSVPGTAAPFRPVPTAGTAAVSARTQYGCHQHGMELQVNPFGCVSMVPAGELGLASADVTDALASATGEALAPST